MRVAAECWLGHSGFLGAIDRTLALLMYNLMVSLDSHLHERIFERLLRPSLTPGRPLQQPIWAGS